MTTSNIYELSRQENPDPLTELLKKGATKLIQQAVEGELQALLNEYSDRLTPEGRKGVVRNGYLPEREVQTGIGPVKVRIPKVRATYGPPVTFNSAIVPPYVRKSKSLEVALPWLYLKGISTGEMQGALEVLVGADAKGLSASTVAKLKATWAKEYDEWREEPLHKDEWVYIWGDGIYSSVRKGEGKLCCLVIVGVNTKGEKKFLAIEDGTRESTQSWREVLLKLKSRGINTPQVCIGDGAMGLWSALEEIFPKTCQQRCWVHKTANVLNHFPKSVQPKAKSSLHEIWKSDTKENAYKAFDLFINTYGAKYPRATDCLLKDKEQLLTFYDFPAQHWQSLRTSNPIESTFGTIRHRTKRSKGCLSRNGMLHMMFKLGQCAEQNWRKLRGFNYLAKVITGIKFRNGIEISNNQEAA